MDTPQHTSFMCNHFGQIRKADGEKCRVNKKFVALNVIENIIKNKRKTWESKDWGELSYREYVLLEVNSINNRRDRGFSGLIHHTFMG